MLCFFFFFFFIRIRTAPRATGMIRGGGRPKRCVTITKLLDVFLRPGGDPWGGTRRARAHGEGIPWDRPRRETSSYGGEIRKSVRRHTRRCRSPSSGFIPAASQTTCAYNVRRRKRADDAERDEFFAEP